MKWKILGALAVFTVFGVELGSTPVRADVPCAVTPNVYAVYEGTNPRAYGGVLVTYNDGTNSTSVDSSGGGVFNWTGTQSNGTTPHDYFFQQRSLTGAQPADFFSFCLEVNQNIHPGNAPSKHEFLAQELDQVVPWQDTSDTRSGTRIDPIGSAAATALQKLWGYKMPSLLAQIDDGNISTDDRINIAAMQLAIWEIVSEPVPGTDFDLSNDKLQASTTATNDQQALNNQNLVISRAKTFYDGSIGFSGSLPHLIALTNPCDQDQLVALVPEPTSLLAWCLLGCIGLVTSRRYRRHRG